MHPVAEQLLAQHVKFELEKLTGRELNTSLRAAVAQAFELADELTLTQLATEKRCVAAFRRLVVNANIPPSAARVGVSLFMALAQRLQESGVVLQDVIGQQRFLDLGELVAGLDDPRRRFFAEVFNHPYYGELISGLVYEALVSYLVEDNLISQHVPGVGSMLKLGRRMATRAVPGLDATLERQLKRYIRGYLPTLVNASEQFVESTVSDAALRDNLAEAWPDIGGKPLAGLFEDLTPEDAARIGDWTLHAWNDLRQSDAFADLAEALIAALFERYGNQPVSALLSDLGITRGMLSKELVTFAPPLLKHLRKSGLLEELLKSRLEPFYASPAVTRVLEKDR